MIYDDYADLVTLHRSISSIDFGDSPEDGDKFRLPQFTGGNANLYPDEFSGRHGETIPSAGKKINGNFASLLVFLEKYRVHISDAIGKQSIFIDIDDSELSGVSEGMCVYQNPTSGKYEPYTLDLYKSTGKYMTGVYLKRNAGIPNEPNLEFHRIYTHGYIHNISNESLRPGKTYGLDIIGISTPRPQATSYNYIIRDNIIPVFKAVSTTDGILIANRPIGDDIVYPLNRK
jgi:hypothetical protein